MRLGRELALRNLLSVLTEIENNRFHSGVRLLIRLDEMLSDDTVSLAQLADAEVVYSLATMRGELLSRLITHVFSVLDHVIAIRVSHQLEPSASMLSYLMGRVPISDDEDDSVSVTVLVDNCNESDDETIVKEFGHRKHSPRTFCEPELFLDCYDFPVSALDGPGSGSVSAILAM